jgi:hypothetical protein
VTSSERPEAFLHFRFGGSSGKSLFDARRKFSHTILNRGSDVAVVEVHRPCGIRPADVSTGPRWLAVLWIPDDPATVDAFNSDGALTFSWISPREAV